MAIPTDTRRVRCDWRQHVTFEQSAREDLPHLCVSQPLLREKRLIGLFAELAVEALGLRDLRNLSIDKSLREREVELLREGEKRLLVDEVVQERIEVAGDCRIIGVGFLLPNLLEPALHRLAHLWFCNLFAADLCERRTAETEIEDCPSRNW